MSAAPLVIAHRGASGHLPEHTLEAYELAIRQGADYIEPDLVVTRDGVLVARHENELSDTTDVADHPELAGRRTTRRIDGRAVTGWFCEDLTLAEVKRLRARERLPGRSHAHDGRFLIPAFAEVVELALAWGARRGRAVGLYPETKHPSYFASLGLPLEPRLLDALGRAGLDRRDGPVFLQSFETANLRRLAALTRLPLVQLLGERHERPWDLVEAGDPRTVADLVAPEGLRQIAGYAAAVGCSKRLLVPEGAGGRLGPPTSLAADAHAAGLAVHAWTFRSDPPFLSAEYGGDAGREYERFFALGVDGVFSDFPDQAVAARGRWQGAP